MSRFEPQLLVRAAEGGGRPRRKQGPIVIVILAALVLALFALAAFSAGWAVEPVFS